MRFGQVAPILFGTFVALACGSTGDGSKVGDSTANGNINTGATGNNGSGSTGNIDTGNGATTGSNGGAGSVDQNSACTSTSADGEPTPVDLYFMVDITGSMNCPVPDGGMMCDMVSGPPASGDSRWTVVSAALKSFIADPANQSLGVGMRFFPIGGNTMGGSNTASCNANSYATPNVEIGPLSMTAGPLTTAIDMQTPGGSTPTVPSLTAALDHATAWAKANPTHRVAVVYATDGQPNGCGQNNTVQNAAAAALKAALGTPAIPTYVLGVGPSLTNLNSIAENGGTKAAFLVDTAGNAASQLSAALASIRSTSALDCTYTIPAPPKGQTLDPSKVNITYTNSAGTVTTLLQDPAGTSCDAGSGWQYSADGKTINLCGKACNDVKADKNGKLQVLFGCTTQVGNPPK